jgi:hypothetical protein
MRTTIEIPDAQRAKLLELAARRGEKGFSSIVQEALAQYFAGEEARIERVRRAIGVLGSLSVEEADRLTRGVRDLRRTWR